MSNSESVTNSGYLRLPAAILKHSAMTAGCKALTAKIMTSTNNRRGKCCTRSYRAFADETGVSPATISRSYKRLQEHFPGFITREKPQTYTSNICALKSRRQLKLEHYFVNTTFTFGFGKNAVKRPLTRNEIFYVSYVYALAESLVNKGTRPDAVQITLPARKAANILGVSERTALKTLHNLIKCRLISDTAKRSIIKPDYGTLNYLMRVWQARKRKAQTAAAEKTEERRQAAKQRAFDREEFYRRRREENERRQEQLEKIHKANPKYLNLFKSLKFESPTFFKDLDTLKQIEEEINTTLPPEWRRPYHCELCQDTGIIQEGANAGTLCSCYDEYLKNKM